MMKKNVIIASVASIIFLGVVGVLVGTVVQAAPTCPAGTIRAGVCFPADTGLVETRSVAEVLGTVVGWLAFIFSMLAIITLIICGMKYLFSMGDSTTAEEAKKCMMWAIVGALVAGGAFVIMNTIVYVLTGLLLIP